MTDYPSLQRCVGETPLVRLRRLPGATSNTLLAKLEGDNPAGSVKDRPAYSMIRRAAERGEIEPGDTLIEATSGNTGIALAMVAAMEGYRLRLIMPETASEERRATMRAYGAELILVSADEGMEGARDLAQQMQRNGEGQVLDQFANADNPRAHYETTAPEIWRATGGRITHFVATMGTTGTIMGCSRFFKEQNPDIQIIGVQPAGESSIPGIRAWPEAYLPSIFERERVDRIVNVAQDDAESTMKALAREEGIFSGPSSGGSAFGALTVAREASDATIAMIICDRGDRYLSTGVYDKPE
ncbi:cysteine synthase CysM [Salinisphaera sp. USBA-960]|uniref:cysteine synthase CysM n=1 Tax=Salinisphaera orenii TaxID=856731 RepID=UPI000DBE428B|nr:cysteine synthase CysM [Salifodinibacter halophilus]NNC25884.1 cysteine synthase CysM [Salifodinibacter halophilus]